MDIEKIIAEEGMVFQRIHDSMMFGNEIYLGIDYSTGTAREDKAEYYEQVPKPERDETIEPEANNEII
jgi:hypothetical protein